MNRKSALTPRRARLHQSARDEILDHARAQIAAVGASALSLRAIARAMQLTAPALYRYFANRDELVTALIIAAFGSLADALQSARDARASNGPAAQLRAIALAYRDWARAHPQDYLLIFGAPIPGYVAPAERTAPEAKRALDVLIDAVATLHHSGELAVATAYTNPPAALRAQLNAWKKKYGYAAPLPALHFALTCWSRLHGIVSLELDHQLQPILGDAGEFYAAQVDELLARLGLKSR